MTRKILYYSDFVLAPLAALVILFLHEYQNLGFDAFCFLSGIVLWSFLEYLLHRGAHFLQLAEHYRHHHWPQQDSAPSIFLAVPIAGLTWWCFPPLVVAGLLLNYTFFICLHWSMHHLTIRPSNIFYGAKVRHDAHHGGREVNFGVTSRIWDVFFTRR